MGIIGSDKLNASLSKAKNIGLVEESFTLEGCELTLRNLRPGEYVAALEACNDLEEAAYLHGYQIEHIARSIVEINGTDLRDVQFVEVEEEDPKNEGQTRTVKLELHAYLLQNLISTWGKEAVYTAYRKFTDVVDKAEKKAQEGVKFLIPDETAEEKYRRLLLEAKEAESELPDSLVDNILEGSGYMRKTTAEELRKVMERTDQMAREQEEAPPEPPQPAPEAPPPTPQPEPQQATQEPPKDRQPMNQSPGKVPDPHRTLQDAIQARQQTPSTEEAQEEEEDPSKPGRADRIAALEADAETTAVKTITGADGKEIPVYRRPERQDEVMEIRKQAPVDPKEAGTILDRPPVAGVNPRFKPPPKL